MPRRAPLVLALLAVGVCFALLVGRLPPDLERTVVTRRHHNSDPLLTAALLRFNLNALVSSPGRYFRPPILHPDPNPLRGTEPLVSEALLALPLRLALGDRPALVFTLTKLLTLALVAVFTGLMLRELGVRGSLVLAGAALSVSAGTLAMFVDRLQAVSIQWLPLAAVFAARILRHGRARDAWLFGASVFLAAQASLYTSAMLLVPAPFVLAAAWGQRRALPRGAILRVAGAVLGAGALSALVLWPYARQRADVAVWSSEAYAAAKSWSPALLADLATAAPEHAGFPLGPEANWDGAFPGWAVVLLALAWLALVASRPRGVPRAGDAAAFRLTGPALVVALAALAVVVAASELGGPGRLSRALAQALLLAALALWALRLALWPSSRESEAGRLGLLASTAGAGALALLLVALGSPVLARYGGPPLLEGLFAPLSSVLPPIRELRELKRCLLPAGWLAVVALTLALERRLRTGPARLAPVLATAVLLVAGAERLRADTRKATAPEVPPPYARLAESRGRGGLLELPYEPWGRIAPVHRMLFQPSHGRPIADGRTGIAPAWHPVAQRLYDEFPAEETLRLLRSFRIDTVLDTRDASSPWPAGVVLRAEERAQAGRRVDATWRVFDVDPDGPGVPRKPEPGPGEWRTPRIGTGEAQAAMDGSSDTAYEVSDPEGVVVRIEAQPVALELAWKGRFARVPRGLRVLGQLSDGSWRDLGGAGTAWLRARAAKQLLERHEARLVVPLERAPVTRLRLVSFDVPWDLVEVRVRVEEPPR